MQQENAQDHVFSSGPNDSSYVTATLLADRKHPGQVLLVVWQDSMSYLLNAISKSSTQNH